MASETVEILQKAKALIDAPEKWTREAFARDESGTRVDFEHSEASCFCCLGAIARTARADFGPDYECGDAVKMFRHANLLPSVSAFNDDKRTSHADVMAAFDRAIELAKTEA